MMMHVVDEGTLDGFVVLAGNNNYYYARSYVTLHVHILYGSN
jgi:hypothetical protein